MYAKTPGPINVALLDGYRHEFSSIEVAAKDEELLKLPRELQELALHLIAAHHGYGRPVIGVSGCEDAPPSKLEGRRQRCCPALSPAFNGAGALGTGLVGVAATCGGPPGLAQNDWPTTCAGGGSQ